MNKKLSPPGTPSSPTPLETRVMIMLYIQPPPNVIPIPSHSPRNPCKGPHVYVIFSFVFISLLRAKITLHFCAKILFSIPYF